MRTKIDQVNKTLHGQENWRFGEDDAVVMKGVSHSLPVLLRGCHHPSFPSSLFLVGTWGCHTWRTAAYQRKLRRGLVLDKDKGGWEGDVVQVRLPALCVAFTFFPHRKIALSYHEEFQIEFSYPLTQSQGCRSVFRGKWLFTLFSANNLKSGGVAEFKAPFTSCLIQPFACF